MNRVVRTMFWIVREELRSLCDLRISASCNENGKRRGYIDVLKELWEDKGYGHL